MTQIIKAKPATNVLKTILQIDEDEIGGIIIKSTSLDSSSQIHFILTRLEKMRIAEYFKEFGNEK